jgi:NADH-quinone oxidoreductase subunit L
MLSRPDEDRSVLSVLYTWLPVGGLHVDMAFRADQLSIVMALFVTGIGALIHLYAIGYMHGDPKFSKFFVYLNLFIFSMLVLVLGSNLVVTFLGWEGVGRLLLPAGVVLADAAPRRRRRARRPSSRTGSATSAS